MKVTILVLIIGAFSFIAQGGSLYYQEDIDSGDFSILRENIPVLNNDFFNKSPEEEPLGKKRYRSNVVIPPRCTNKIFRSHLDRPEIRRFARNYCPEKYVIHFIRRSRDFSDISVGSHGERFFYRICCKGKRPGRLERRKKR